MQPQLATRHHIRKLVGQSGEAHHDVMDDICNSACAVADRVDRLSCDRLVHSPSIGGGFGRTCDPADHRALQTFSRLVLNRPAW